MADCVYRQWFLEVFLGPFCNVDDRIMPMSDAVSSEGPKTTGIKQRSSALSLTHRDFSSFSESFDDVMHCRWWDLQSICHLMLRNVVFKVFHNLFTHSFTDWRASAHLYFWETLPLNSRFSTIALNGSLFITVPFRADPSRPIQLWFRFPLWGW